MNNMIRRIIKGLKPYGFDYLVRRIKYPSLRMKKYNSHLVGGGGGV
jgi:hypothetical protein